MKAERWALRKHLQINNLKMLLALWVFSALLCTCTALECYVCTQQDGNTEKCLRTIKTCEQGEDYCLTTIAWGSHPYWTSTADKQYYVSKQCATKDLCDRTWNETLPYCERIWYLDWRCSECCLGDRCNYFITLSANTAQVNFFGVSCFTLFAIYLWRRN